MPPSISLVVVVASVLVTMMPSSESPPVTLTSSLFRGDVVPMPTFPPVPLRIRGPPVFSTWNLSLIDLTLVSELSAIMSTKSLSLV